MSNEVKNLSFGSSYRFPMTQQGVNRAKRELLEPVLIRLNNPSGTVTHEISDVLKYFSFVPRKQKEAFNPIIEHLNNPHKEAESKISIIKKYCEEAAAEKKEILKPIIQELKESKENAHKKIAAIWQHCTEGTKPKGIDELQFQIPNTGAGNGRISVAEKYDGLIEGILQKLGFGTYQKMPMHNVPIQEVDNAVINLGKTNDYVQKGKQKKARKG